MEFDISLYTVSVSIVTGLVQSSYTVVLIWPIITIEFLNSAFSVTLKFAHIGQNLTDSYVSCIPVHKKTAVVSVLELCS